MWLYNRSFEVKDLDEFLPWTNDADGSIPEFTEYRGTVAEDEAEIKKKFGSAHDDKLSLMFNKKTISEEVEYLRNED